MSGDPAANYVFVETLGSALRYGGAALSDVPDLIARILDEERWQRFVTPRGEPVEHDRWEDFVTTPPTKGLGASEQMIDRIIGDRHELREKIRAVKKVGRGGPPSRPRKDVDSTRLGEGEDSAYTAQRLREQHPDEYAAVERGEKSLHRAARDAGIRKPRIMVRLDNPESAAATLRNHMAPDVLARLKELL